MEDMPVEEKKQTDIDEPDDIKKMSSKDSGMEVSENGETSFNDNK